MPRTTKGAKSTKKGRTKVKNLPVGEKELTAKEKKHVKGGFLVQTSRSPSVTLGTPPTINYINYSDTDLLKAGDTSPLFKAGDTSPLFKKG